MCVKMTERNLFYVRHNKAVFHSVCSFPSHSALPQAHYRLTHWFAADAEVILKIKYTSFILVLSFNPAATLLFSNCYQQKMIGSLERWTGKRN